MNSKKLRYKRLTDANSRARELDRIVDVLEDTWGKFPQEIIRAHILDSSLILIAEREKRIVAFCAINEKEFYNKKFIYVEFLVVRHSYQKQGLGLRLLQKTVVSYMLRQMPFRLLLTNELLFITPNVQILKKVNKFAKLIYPNPWRQMGKDGKIAPADDDTWLIAKKLLKNSDNPKRKLDREGLVLHGSYARAPWLINNWAKDDEDHNLQQFIEKYLEYHLKADRELIVRAQFSFLNLIKIWLL